MIPPVVSAPPEMGLPARAERLLPRPRKRLAASDAVPPEWAPILPRLRLSPRQLDRLAARSAAHGTSFQIELFASGMVPEGELCQAIAAALDIGLVEEVDAARLVIAEPDRRVALRSWRGLHHALLVTPDGATVYLVSPARTDLAGLARALLMRPTMRTRLRLVLPSALRRAIIMRSRGALLADARSSLFVTHPEFSARLVATGAQGLALGSTLVLLAVGLVLAPSATWLALHVVFSLFFLPCVCLRMLPLAGAVPPAPALLLPVDRTALPVYSVLVALYREAPIVPQLMVALSRIDWPRSKLEIKLVCEADDHDTLAAIRALPLHTCVEVIEVPPGPPRTKPKALAYALPFCAGEYVTLYDAEDVPHRDQLLEAWLRFREAGPEVACLQAPLDIVNGHRGMLPRMFAFEYAALFRGLLPWLARRRLVLPLGGTSNHFRREALEAVCSWDPYNVTEDADIGMRLARFGYRSETITRPTSEDASLTLRAWTGQRSRWFKGWMQTWLVHSRHPLRTFRSLGPASFLVSQVLFLGLVVSALSHPVFLGTAIAIVIGALAGMEVGAYHATLLVIDAVNIVGGYLAFLALGRSTLRHREARGFWKVVLVTPFYWMAMSFAAWRAFFQLFADPHHWEKTDHPPTRLFGGLAGGERRMKPL